MNMKLGKIRKIDLRDVWASESSDFTPWLAKEENIAMLVGMCLFVGFNYLGQRYFAFKED